MQWKRNLVFGTWNGGTERAEIAGILRKIFRSERNKVKGEWRRLHNEELQVVYSSPNSFATSRNVAGSMPDSVIGIFQLHNPSDRTVALRSTQFPTEISTGIFLGGKDDRCVELTPLTTFMYRLSCNLEASTFRNPQGLYRDFLTFTPHQILFG